MMASASSSGSSLSAPRWDRMSGSRAYTGLLARCAFLAKVQKKARAREAMPARTTARDKVGGIL